MKSTFTFEFNDEDNYERQEFLNNLNGSYTYFLFEFEQFLRTFRKHGNSQFGELTEEQHKLYYFINEQYFEMKTNAKIKE